MNYEWKAEHLSIDQFRHVNMLTKENKKYIIYSTHCLLSLQQQYSLKGPKTLLGKHKG